jgi:hypothetical protein
LLVSQVMDKTMTNFPICPSDQNDFLVHRTSPLFSVKDRKVNALPADVIGRRR